MHKKNKWLKAWGPASLSNLGPGFDTLGLCISDFGDVVSGCLTSKKGIEIESISGDEGNIPREAHKNTACLAAQTVFDQAGYSGGLILRIQKNIPLGSGIGGSAASAVAGAWLANALLDFPFEKDALIEAVLAGESLASGSRHGDNVLPALFGGLVVVGASEPTSYQKIVLPTPIYIALLLPQVNILTKEARALLPQQVSFREAIYNASDLAQLLVAYSQGDWEKVGIYMMKDRFVEPVRARLIPCYDAVKQAVLDSGNAVGFALSGSGPALFALSETPLQAIEVVKTMVKASEKAGVSAQAKMVTIDTEGVRMLP